MGRQVLKWILASQAKFGKEQAKANELGDRLAKLGLVDEAMNYWSRSAFLDLDSSEALSCISSLLENRGTRKT